LRVERARLSEPGDLGAVRQHGAELEVSALHNEAAVVEMFVGRRFLFVGTKIGFGVGGRKERSLRTCAVVIG
jgi:hypothetical protein